MGYSLSERVGRFGGPLVETFAGAHTEVSALDLVGQHRRNLCRGGEIGKHILGDGFDQIPSRQLEDLEDAGHRPAAADAVTEGVVDITWRGDAVLDQPQGFAQERALQSIEHEAGNLAAYDDGPLADHLEHAAQRRQRLLGGLG